MAVDGKEIKVSVAAAPAGDGARRGEVWICAVSKAVPIAIGRGENRGREVTYHNVVRNLLKVGDWTGAAGSWSVPLENIADDGVDAAVVYVQDGSRDKPGRDARRGLHLAALSGAFPSDRAIRMGCGRGSARTAAPDKSPPQNKKGPTCVGPGWGFGCCVGPIPTASGGWGLRNPKPKEPGQRSDDVLASRAGVRWAKFGR